MGSEGSGAVSALMRLDGFRVRAQTLEAGEWWLAVETTAERVGCEGCGTRAAGHGRRRVQVRDLAVAGTPVRLVWAKRIWRCPEVDCAAKTWSEESDEIAPRAVLTERARAEICRRVGPDEHSVAQAARDFGVSWHTAMAAVVDHGHRVDHLARLGAPTAIGLDETSWLAATVEHPTLLVTGIVDLDAGRLVDVLPERSADAVSGWLGSKPTGWRDRIRYAVIDPYAGYAKGLADGLDHATVVVDHFNAVRLANQALDEVRRRTQQATTGHRGRKGDPLYRIRRRLLAAHERLAPEAFERTLTWLTAGDPDGEVAAAYLAKELLREVYATRDPFAARRALEAFHAACGDADIHELARLSRTVRRWEPQILGWHRTGLTNAAVEGTNLIVKNVKRLGFGFTNFANYRLRLLLRCGAAWQHRPVASIRPRQPRFIA
jgi:transposase